MAGATLTLSNMFARCAAALSPTFSKPPTKHLYVCKSTLYPQHIRVLPNEMFIVRLTGARQSAIITAFGSEKQGIASVRFEPVHPGRVPLESANSPHSIFSPKEDVTLVASPRLPTSTDPIKVECIRLGSYRDCWEVLISAAIRNCLRFI